MPTLTLHADAFGLIRSAHRLSDAAAQAVQTATHDSTTGLWSLTCPPVASELWVWFDDCEQHAALLAREAWKVSVCRRAKKRITKAR